MELDLSEFITRHQDTFGQADKQAAHSARWQTELSILEAKERLALAESGADEQPVRAPANDAPPCAHDADALVSTTFHYRGLGGKRAVCGLFLSRTLSTVIVTELPTNEGSSITNVAEQLAWQLCETYALDPATLVYYERYSYRTYNQSPQSFWVERDLPEGETEELSLVTFDTLPGKRFTAPRWHPLSQGQRQQLYAQLGLG